MLRARSRCLTLFGACGLFALATSAWWSIGTARQAKAADLPVVNEGRLVDFLDSIGICAHLTDRTSSYADVDRALSQLQRLGIHHIRDDVRGSAPQQAAILQRARAQGIGTTLIVSASRLPVNEQNLE